VATGSSPVRRFSKGPLHGTALALYFVLLPYVVVTKWTLTQDETNGTLVRILLVALGIFWLAFLFQVGQNILRLRQGVGLGAGGTAWLAGIIVAALPFLVSSAASAAVQRPHSPSALSAKASDSPWLMETGPQVPERAATQPQPEPCAANGTAGRGAVGVDGQASARPASSTAVRPSARPGR
jgi:hypothetical protein